VRGVVGINNDLESHASAAGVPSLQGEGKVGRRSRATRALVAAGVIATGVVLAIRRRGSHHWKHQHVGDWEHPYAGGWATNA
jgi:hypothetical protein